MTNRRNIKVRHKNKKSNCLFCKKSFSHFSWDKQAYCSKDCYYKKEKIKVLCEVCQKECFKSKSLVNRNGVNYCSRDCYNNRRKENLKRIKRHTGYFTELVSKGCCCGIKEYYLLQIHHCDGDINNNHPENHEVVCANCHIKRHLKLNKQGKLVYHTKTLTDINIYNLL